jgi:aryl carrier-like protein
MIKLSELPEYAQWFKLLKMGEPKQAVANKMATKGADASVLDKHPESTVPGPSAAAPAGGATQAPTMIKLGEHPEYAQWFKLLKLGMPKQAVANKMAMKGVDASVLDKDPESMVPDPSAAALPTAEPAAPTMIKLAKHPEYAQWFKLLKLGVPKQVVGNKMTAKGVGASVLDKDPDRGLVWHLIPQLLPRHKVNHHQ